ncbi:MAG: rod shape-determining protein MreD [Spirochaetes bacterium]|nr:rod shape-determining protein MreD [Spirochaetota bacterium]
MIIVYIITGILILVSLVIQSHSSLDVIRIFGVKPDFVFIIVVYTGYSFGSITGQVTGFVSGLFHDAVSNSPYGFLALPKLTVGFIVGLLGRAVLKNNVPTIIILMLVSTLVKGIITLLLSYIFAQGMISGIIDVIIPEALYNAILAPPLFFLFDKIFRGELEREGYL